jgi:hypothetical protein
MFATSRNHDVGRDRTLCGIQKPRRSTPVLLFQSPEQLSRKLAPVATQNMGRHAKRAAEPFDLGIAGAVRRVGDQGVNVAGGQLAAQPGEIEEQVVALFATPGAYEMVKKPVDQVVVDHVHPGHAFIRSVAAEQRLVDGR